MTATPAVRSTRISPSEPVSELRRIKIVENGEPLVDFLRHCPDLLLDRDRFHYRRETVVRQTVAEMLCKAAQALPSGHRLLMVEGWRAPHIQRRMYLAIWQRFREQHPDWSEVTLKRVVNRFSAPMNLRVPPPHTTGGAVDVMLADAEGNPVNVTDPFDPYNPKCFAFAAPGLTPEAREHRRILADAMLSGGLTNYPSEYWHWSYGDQGWAYRNGKPNALYAAITPPDWMPAPGDDIDGPLVFVE